MSRKPILSALVVIAAAYVAYPYVALYRLEAALRSGNPAALQSMIDWDRVRDGLKQDISDEVDGVPEQQPVATAQAASATLPPFGSSFIKGIASKTVDSVVTPESLARMAQPREEPQAAEEPDPIQAVSFGNAPVKWAFFQSPATFTLWLRPASEASGEDPVKLRMQLIDGEWKITRVWLPPSLLRKSTLDRKPG
jgi:hypothetical protein